MYVIWQGDTTNSSDIYFASSKDNGNTFGKIVNLSYSSTGRSFSPQIVTSGNNVYVIWQDHSVDRISTQFMTIRSDVSTFGKIVNLSYSSTGRSFSPQIVTSGNNVYVIWLGTNNSGYDHNNVGSRY